MLLFMQAKETADHQVSFVTDVLRYPQNLDGRVSSRLSVEKTTKTNYSVRYDTCITDDVNYLLFWEDVFPLVYTLYLKDSENLSILASRVFGKPA